MTKQQEMRKEQAFNEVKNKLLDVLEEQDLLDGVDPADYEEIVA